VRIIGDGWCGKVVEACKRGKQRDCEAYTCEQPASNTSRLIHTRNTLRGSAKRLESCCYSRWHCDGQRLRLVATAIDSPFWANSKKQLALLEYNKLVKSQPLVLERKHTRQGVHTLGRISAAPCSVNLAGAQASMAIIL
jgi:hypothetical protein